MQYHPLTTHIVTPLKQISAATWPAALGVILSLALIVAVCLTTNGEETNDSILTANAAVLVAVGGVVLKGSLGSLLGIALYHRLWLLLGHRNRGESKDGLTVKEIESHHLASRLAVGMLVEPSASLAWACGLLCLLLTASIVPVLQYGMDIVPSSATRPTTVQIDHAQLDSRMATRSGAAGNPDNVAPNVLRAATRALFGGDSAFVYDKHNLTGAASFANVQYADVECNIDVSLGLVEPTSRSDWYYNFTYDYVTADSDATTTYNYYQALRFKSTLNNNTHYLHHDCQIRAAVGTCSIPLNNGTGLMKSLSCMRSSWLTQEQLPNTVDSPAIGFFAISAAFISLFEGEAWTSATQGRPQENSTFVAATAKYFNRSSIGMPEDLLSHVRRTLWHSAINARPFGLPASEIGGPYDLNSTADMLVQDETPVLLVKVDYVVISIVLGVAAIMAILAIVYPTVASNHVPGRLMRDSLVHTLSVAARQPHGNVAVSPLTLPDTSNQSLEQILKAGTNLRLRCILANDSNNVDGCPRLVLEQGSQQNYPMLTGVVHSQPQKADPLISRDPSPRPHLPSSRQSYQTRPPSISSEPSVYFHEPADFHDISRQYRIRSGPETGYNHIPAHLQQRSDRPEYCVPPSVQCNCKNPEHRH